LRSLGLGVAVAVVAAALAPDAAVGQGAFTLRPLDGQLGTEFRGRFSSVPGRRTFSTSYFWEWVDVRLLGSVLHPRVFQFKANLRPTWTQGIGTENDVRESDGSTLLDYGLEGRFFPASPVSLSARGRRLRGSAVEVFARPREYDMGEIGSLLNVRLPYLPFSIDVRRESRAEAWGPLTTTDPFRDETSSVVDFRARNSKLAAGLEWRDYEDLAIQRRFTRWLGNASHRFRWGKGSLLQSSVRYLDRRGDAPLEQFSWHERVNLRHTRRVTSDWRYSQTSNSTGVFNSTARSALGLMAYDASRSLRATVEGRGSWVRSSTVRRDELRALPRVAFSRVLGGGIGVRAHVGVGYERVRQEAANGVVPVVEELHVVDQSRQFRLEEPFPEPSSVVVKDARGAQVFRQGLDYQTAPGGSRLTVFVLPGGTIAVGDTLLIDYEYRLSPTARSEGMIATYGIAVDWRGFGVYLRRDLRDLKDQMSYEMLLGQDYLTIGATFMRSAGPLHANVRAEYERFRYNGTLVNTYLGSANVDWNIVAGWAVRLGGTAMWKRGTAAPLDNALATTEISWTPSGSLRLSAHADGWRWERDGTASQSSLSVGFGGDYRIGLLRLTARYDRGRYVDGQVLHHNRLHVRLTRDF
jgi:hypothetical protein